MLKIIDNGDITRIVRVMCDGDDQVCVFFFNEVGEFRRAVMEWLKEGEEQEDSLRAYTCPQCGRISYYTTESPLPCPYCEEEQLTCRRCGTTEGYFNGGYCADCWMQMALKLQDEIKLLRAERRRVNYGQKEG